MTSFLQMNKWKGWKESEIKLWYQTIPMTIKVRCTANSVAKCNHFFIQMKSLCHCSQWTQMKQHMILLIFVHPNHARMVERALVNLMVLPVIVHLDLLGQHVVIVSC